MILIARFFSLCFLVFGLIALSAESTHSQEASTTLVAFTKQESDILIRFYDTAGEPKLEYAIPPKNIQAFLSGKFSSDIHLGVLIKDNTRRYVRFYNDQGAMTHELSLPAESVNTLFAADVDNSGTDELVSIERSGSRDIINIFYSPASPTGTASSIALAGQALYYSPAMSGSLVSGILSYSPKVSGAKAKSNLRARLQAKKKKKKKPSPKGSKEGAVDIYNFAGQLVSRTVLKGALDGQIYPVSLDGSIGFGIFAGTKFKVFSSTGTAVSEHTIPSGASVQTGSFTVPTNFHELAVSQNTSVLFINLLTKTSTSIALKGFPDRIRQIEEEVQRLTQELINAIKNGKSPDEIRAIQERIMQLNQEKLSATSGGSLASSLFRIFTGGAGAIEGVCDVVFENPNDGYGGFLIKNSDKDGRIVALTPGGKNYIDAALLKFKSYKVIENLVDSGYGNPDSHGARKHFRGKRPPASYGPFIFRAVLKASFFDTSGEGEKHCWYVKKPSARVD